MAANKGKVEKLHDLLPKHLGTKTNTNWKALVEALGESDQKVADLIAEVRKQFFVKTASRPYLDRLAANNKIARPKFVGMDDPSFRQYIPVLSYQPKQVKLIIDQLLDIFFFKESTTAFVTSQNSSPFYLENGWELSYVIDEQYTEQINFKSSDFTNINAAAADEIVAAINRQTKYSYATAYYDSITKNTFMRLFTNTVGSKGSIRFTGGRAAASFRFNGFIDDAGNGNNTTWTITKVGDDTTYEYVGGISPNLSALQQGDIIISNLPGNVGSFKINEINIAENKIVFKNLFSTPGTFSQTSDLNVKFLRPEKYVAYKNPRRAMTWETSPGEIVVEMPTSPPVVKRSLKGSFHINGQFSLMSNRVSATSLQLEDASLFPNSGSFTIERVNELQTRILTDSENTVLTQKLNSRPIYPLERFEYASRTELATTGDIVEGSNQITNLASNVGLAIGQDVVMDGVPKYAKVTSFSGLIVNISVPATKTVNSGAVSFLGNTLYGITPHLPDAASLNEFTLSSLSRSANIVTGVTSSPHNYIVGESVIVSGSDGIPVTSVTGDTSVSSFVLSNLSSMSGLAPDQLISGPGISAGTKIVSIGLTSLTMSKAATSSNIGASYTFSEDLNGAFPLISASGSTFTYSLTGSNGSCGVPGSARVERVGLSNSGSKIIMLDAVGNDATRIIGTYTWDETATFVLSSNSGSIQDAIQAGKIVRLLNISPGSNISPDGGYVIFNFGRNNQEGPVRYLYKPSDTTIAIDPSYVFKYSHAVNSSVIAINRKGPHTISSTAKEYSPYITDPSEARFILQDLIKSVKSAGIFVNFLVRYPEQLYATLDVYSSGIDPG